MSVDLLFLDLRLRRRAVLGTAVGAAAYLLVVIAVYPNFAHDTSFDAVIRANPTAAAAFGISGSITSPEGWLSANLYANFGPLLALLLTIGYGAAAIAGQDADGTLGLFVSLPRSRSWILRQKAEALLALAAVVPVTSYAVCLVGPHFDLHPAWGPLLGASLATGLSPELVGACHPRAPERALGLTVCVGGRRRSAGQRSHRAGGGGPRCPGHRVRGPQPPGIPAT